MNKPDGFYTAEELKARLSISTFVFWQNRPDVDLDADIDLIGRGALEELARSGISKIELFESRPQFDMSYTSSMKCIGDACKSCGIDIAAYHTSRINFQDIETETARRDLVDCCRRQIDTMLELGGTVWSSHVKGPDSTVVKSYCELARHVENTVAVIAVENFSFEETWVEDRMAFLDEMDHPQVGLVLDIGHVTSADGINPMTLPGGPTRILEMCGARLCHLHLHGFKNGHDHFPPLVEGDEIQWVELFRMLRSVGYSGLINFEPQGEPIHHDSVQATAAFPDKIVAIESGSL